MWSAPFLLREVRLYICDCKESCPEYPKNEVSMREGESTMRRGRLLIASGVLLVSCVVSRATVHCAAPELKCTVKAYDINGGFEKVESFTKYEETYRRWIKQGIELPDPFFTPIGWNPQSHPDLKWKMEVVTSVKEAHSGKNYLKLSSGTVYYHNWPWSGVTLKDNDEVTVSVWVKGRAGNPFVVRLYLYGYNKDGKKVNVYDDGAKGDVLIRERATTEWKQYVGTYVVPAKDAVDVPGARVRHVCPALTGKDICFDDVRIAVKSSRAAD